MKYRIVKKPNIWTRSEVYYPEFRWNCWPFWFRFDNGVGYQLHFKREIDAENFINRETNKAGEALSAVKGGDDECPHCGSNKDPFFSRVEPMGYYCRDCGKNADDIKISAVEGGQP